MINWVKVAGSTAIALLAAAAVIWALNMDKAVRDVEQRILYVDSQRISAIEQQLREIDNRRLANIEQLIKKLSDQLAEKK